MQADVIVFIEIEFSGGLGKVEELLRNDFAVRIDVEDALPADVDLILSDG